MDSGRQRNRNALFRITSSQKYATAAFDMPQLDIS
jgi:hypothetical protein